MMYPKHFKLTALLTAVLLLGVIAILNITGQETVAPQRVLVFNQPQSIRQIDRGDRTKKQVIFTFDGGAAANSGDKILDVLAKHHVKGTFFLTGIFVEKNPALVRRMISENHEVFSHTYDHPHLPELTDAEIRVELDKMADTLMSVASTSPKPYFRPPYGDADERVRRIAYLDGYQSVYWTVDATDWMTEATPTDVKSRILSTLEPGAIYLMHIGDDITGEILDEILTDVEARGYKPVSLTQGM